MKTTTINCAVASIVIVSAIHASALPKITPEFISEVQRVCITLDIATFPIRQGDLKRELDLPPFEWGLGVGGAGRQAYWSCPISDKSDALGYYALRIFFGDHKSNPADTMVTKIEVAYEPNPTPGYPPFGALIYVPDRDKKHIEQAKASMAAMHVTPAEFVRKTYAEIKRRGVNNSPNRATEPTQSAAH